MSSKTPLQLKKVNSFLPYPNDHIPNPVLIKAEKELRETPEVKRIALEELKTKLQGIPKLKKIYFKQDFLIHYLRASKYSTEKTFTVLQNYIALRKKYKYLFRNIPDEYFSTKKSLRAVTILPERCKDGCPVFFIQVGKYDSRELSYEDIKKFFLMLYVQLLRDPIVQICGYKAIYDFKGANLHYLRLFNFETLYLLYHIPMNCYPSRIKEIHFVNSSIVLTTSWKIISPFLSEKIRKRCLFHSNSNKLLDYFPASILPSEYGGDRPDIDTTKLARKLNSEHQNFPLQGQNNFY